MNNDILYLLTRRFDKSTVFVNAYVGDGDIGGNGGKVGIVVGVGFGSGEYGCVWLGVRGEVCSRDGNNVVKRVKDGVGVGYGGSVGWGVGVK